MLTLKVCWSTWVSYRSTNENSQSTWRNGFSGFSLCWSTSEDCQSTWGFVGQPVKLGWLTCRIFSSGFSMLVNHWFSLVDMQSSQVVVSVDMLNSVFWNFCVSRPLNLVSWPELMLVVYQSTCRLAKTCFLLFYISIDFVHIFSRCAILKHFKHIVKY